MRTPLLNIALVQYRIVVVVIWRMDNLQKTLLEESVSSSVPQNARPSCHSRYLLKSSLGYQKPESLKCQTVGNTIAFGKCYRITYRTGLLAVRQAVGICSKLAIQKATSEKSLTIRRENANKNFAQISGDSAPLRTIVCKHHNNPTHLTFTTASTTADFLLFWNEVERKGSRLVEFRLFNSLALSV